MLPARFTVGPASSIRKSRLEGKPSFLPKPRRPGSMERMSSDAKRPSNVRSSSADPPRATIAVSRHSKEASASKILMKGRSRSQQGVPENRYYSQVAMTPLSTRKYSRTTTTPVRTPTEDRMTRSWQSSVERAIASVTVKDNRAIHTVGWQRTALARVQSVLAICRGTVNGNAALTRPLTITRFVEITGSLLTVLTKDSRLNNDNYVTRLPLAAKRLLYPGNVSKSWLKTVNTLHAYPQALALISYLVDLVTRIETPVIDDEVYIEKDEPAQLRREYLLKCWIRFQEPEYQFEDINNEYLENLKLLLGNDEEKIAELETIVNEYQLCLEDAAEVAARAHEGQRVAARGGLLAALRGERAARVATRAAGEVAATAHRSLVDSQRALEADIERAMVESQHLKRELEEQPMSVVERTKLLEEVDYANRVIDSKQVLAQQISKIVFSKETELALWQKKTLDCCVEYKERLIQLSATYPDLAQLAIDEKELMADGCTRDMAAALDTLKQKHASLLQHAATREREKQSDKRRRANKLNEVRAALEEVKANIEREQRALESEQAREASDVAVWTAEQRTLAEQVAEIHSREEEYVKVENELAFWEKQNDAWTKKLIAFRSYINMQRDEAERQLAEQCNTRANLVLLSVTQWHEKLDQIDKK